MLKLLLDCDCPYIGVLGAETSEEIAVSIVAEIKAEMSGKHGTSLKYRTEKIHNATYVV